jgi:23S rRNA pseudouridine2605 synthase
MNRKAARRHSHAPGKSAVPAGQRLQKVLAAAGLGSRRECEELIREGRVEVDRKVVTELGTRVDPDRQEIRVDGEPLRPRKKVYYAVHKPPGVVTTQRDPSGRPRVIDLVPSEQRVFAVGRLDRSSEGLIFVTNDGEFANRIMHPRYGVEKTYLVRVAGVPEPHQLARLKRGVHLAEGVARVQRVAVKRRHGQSTDLVIVLNEGRNREIRRILAKVGHKVLALKRVAIGSVKLADLPPGGWRRLTPQEVARLLEVAQPRKKPARAPAAPKLRAAPGAPPAAPAAAIQAEDEAQGLEPSPLAVTSQTQKALLDEPLSLDDLLRDDLDEGGLGDEEDLAQEAALPPTEAPMGPPLGRAGRVIGAEEFAPPPQPAPGRFGQREATLAWPRHPSASPQKGKQGRSALAKGAKQRKRRGKSAFTAQARPRKAKSSAARPQHRRGRRRKG